MENDDNNLGETKPGVVSNVLIFLGVSIFLIFLTFMGLKGFRNRNCWELSERFVRNNETIKQEVGNITRFGRTAKTDRISWEFTGKVHGERKTIEVTVSAYESGFDGGAGCNISAAKYKDEKGTWNEIPVGWFDNLLLMFK